MICNEYWYHSLRSLEKNMESICQGLFHPVPSHGFTQHSYKTLQEMLGGSTALYMASVGGHSEVIAWLLAKQAR